jgi:hypothetical protein
MSIIKSHLQIELSIDQILYRLRLLSLNELQNKNLTLQNITTALSPSSANKRHHNRPGLESRSTSQLNVTLKPMMSSIDEEKPRKRTEIIDPSTMQQQDYFVVKSSQSTPVLVALSDNIQVVHSSSNNNSKKLKDQQQKELRRERNSTKRGLLMTKPE